MNRHPYLRAYMAGVLVPTWFMVIVLAGFVIARMVYRLPVPIERIIAFPMAAVPNLWGLWNLTYLALALKNRVGLGAWGALLPALLIPAGLLLARHLGIFILTPALGLAVFVPVAAFYYLVWKYLVGFLNEVVGVA
jgi:hypothetical protein